MTCLLCFACDFKGAPGYDMLAEARRKGIQKARNAIRLANRLEVDRTDLAELLNGKAAAELSEHLSKAATELRTLAKSVRRETSRKHNRPSEFLVYLAIYVEKTTGKPRYGDLSTLVDLAYATFDMDPKGGSTSVDAIRKLVERFKTKNPDLLLPNGKFDFENINQKVAIVMLVIIGLSFLASYLKPDANAAPKKDGSRPDANHPPSETSARPD
jgi:hypothetical protein